MCKNSFSAYFLAASNFFLKRCALKVTSLESFFYCFVFDDFFLKSRILTNLQGLTADLIIDRL